MSNSSLELRWSSNSSGMSLRSNVSRTRTHKKKVIPKPPLQNDCELPDVVVLSSSEIVQNAQEHHTPDVRWIKSQDMFGSTEQSDKELPESASSSLSLRVLVSSDPSSRGSTKKNSQDLPRNPQRNQNSDNVKDTHINTKISQDFKQQYRRHQNSDNLKNNKSTQETRHQCRRHRKSTRIEPQRTLHRRHNSPDLFVASVSPSAQTRARASTTQRQTSTTQQRTSATHQGTSPASADVIRTVRSDSELWDTQHLAEVSEELQVRSKHVKKLIRRLIRSKRLSDESLESLKKRIKTF